MSKDGRDVIASAANQSASKETSDRILAAAPQPSRKTPAQRSGQ
jgi:hypothetical protein